MGFREKLMDGQFKKLGKHLPTIYKLIVDSDQHFDTFMLKAMQVNDARREKGKYYYEIAYHEESPLPLKAEKG
jgi:hypothetical protein